MANAIALAPAVPLDLRGLRSRDLKNVEFAWNDAKVVHEFSDTHPSLAGHQLIYLDDAGDLASLGAAMGHCAGAQWVWACEEKLYYFFTIISPNGQPHCTIHTKHKKWILKEHPRDATPVPWKVRNNYCPQCNGGGVVISVTGNKMCPICNGTGLYTPKSKKGEIVKPSGSIYGGCPSIKEVKKAFEDAGQEYEAGKWNVQYSRSTTYDIDPQRAGEYERGNTWDKNFGGIRSRPAHVTDEQWSTYTKNWQAMKAAYDKASGNVKTIGRAFKFDGKELIVMSFSSKGDYTDANAGMKYKAGFHEALIELNKRKKEGGSE